MLSTKSLTGFTSICGVLMALEEPLQAFTSLCGTLNALAESLQGFTRLTELAKFLLPFTSYQASQAFVGLFCDCKTSTRFLPVF